MHSKLLAQLLSPVASFHELGSLRTPAILKNANPILGLLQYTVVLFGTQIHHLRCQASADETVGKDS